MDPERWKQIRQVCHSALEIEPDRRKAYLKEACAGDDSILKEVESLLALQSEAAGVFDSPALDAAARALAEEKEAELRPDLVGRTLQHYRIIAKIGEGGMGVVYRARDEHLKRDVAIKVLPPELMTDPERKKRFVQEARAASALHHPNIVTIHDVTSEGGIDFIAMELVAGKALDQKIGRKGMRLDDALKCAIQIADALATAHAAGIVHRDLKPANILVAESGHVKVLDFGLAKLTQPLNGEGIDSSSVAMSTEEGRIMGTAAYMSPEQAQGKSVDARSDIFSFGAVLYEMSSGRRAFPGDNTASIISEILKSDPPSLNAAIPQDFAKIISHCLRKDPGRRFQHMDDIKIALEDLRAERDSGSSDGGRGLHRPMRSRLLMFNAPIAILALVTIAAVLWVKRRGSETPTLKVIPLTTYSGRQRMPSLSPDGSRVAFSWDGEKQDNFDIYIRMVAGEPPRRLTTDPAPDLYPVWSPDGNWIAFARAGFTYLISPEGGRERKLAPGKPSSWTPDARFLACWGRKSDGDPNLIYLVSIESAELITLPTSPPPGSSGDTFPAISPDGNILAFRRSPTPELSSADLFTIPLGSNSSAPTPVRLTYDAQDIGELFKWTPDGRELIFVSNRGGRIALWRIANLAGARAQRISGTEDAASCAFAKDVPGRLVFQRFIREYSIWCRWLAEPESHFSQPTPIAESVATEMDPQFSPDGSRIAFKSNRTGNDEIYSCRADGTDVLQLTSFRGSVRPGSPRWSNDSPQIVFDGLSAGNYAIFATKSSGGIPLQLTSAMSICIRPSFSRDDRWVYFGSNQTGLNQIWKVPCAGGAAVQITRGGGMEAFESPDGKSIFYVKGWNTAGLWSVPIDGGVERPISALPGVQSGLWGVAEGGIYFLDILSAGPGGPVPLKKYDFATQRISKVSEADKVPPNLDVRFAVTRDGRRFVWTRQDRYESNLMMVENFR